MFGEILMLLMLLALCLASMLPEKPKREKFREGSAGVPKSGLFVDAHDMGALPSWQDELEAFIELHSDDHTIH